MQRWLYDMTINEFIENAVPSECETENARRMYNFLLFDWNSHEMVFVYIQWQWVDTQIERMNNRSRPLDES